VAEEAAQRKDGETRGEPGVERIMAFSDGVFAIAITLLVLDLHVPDVARGLGSHLLESWPSLLSYVLSFVIIGVIWAQHHYIFSLIARSNHTFRLLNVLFLLWVSFIPFPTALLSHYLQNPHEQKLAMAVYAGTFLVGTLPFNLLWRYAAHNGRLLAKDVDPAIVQAINTNYLYGPVIYAVDFALAFISAQASLAVFLAIALFYAIAPMRSPVGAGG
jgi:uncharacterized membrane protein